MRLACQRDKAIDWIVASGADTPIDDHSLDGLTCLFTPLSPKEFSRLLKPDGVLLIASTGPEHLIELRQLIYPQLRNDSFAPAKALVNYFQPTDETTVRFNFSLDDNRNILQLLSMTPHQWRASAQAREKLSSVKQLSLTGDVRLSLFKPR